jgi:hypothetical protein
MQISWVYIQSGSFDNFETHQREYLYTVGFYDPAGKWHPDSDHNSKESAAARVHYLNGGNA